MVSTESLRKREESRKTSRYLASISRRMYFPFTKIVGNMGWASMGSGRESRNQEFSLHMVSLKYFVDIEL